MFQRMILTVVALAALSAFAGEVSLEKDLMPVFAKSCATCHAPDSGVRGAIKNETYFATKEDILGKVGAFIIPGKPEESGLLKVLDQTATFGKRDIPMPPPNSDEAKWSEEDLEKFAEWVKAGAKDN